MDSRELEKKCISVNTINIPPPKGLKINDYRDEIEEAKPSSDPSYWAKQGCGHCYGRGIAGSLTSRFGSNNTMKHEQICSCVTKAWHKWQEKFIEGKRSSLDVNDSLKSQQESAINSSIKQAATEQTSRVLNRVQSLQSEISELKDKSSELPQRVTLRDAERVVEVYRQEVRELLVAAKDKEKQALHSDYEAQRCRSMAKDNQRRAKLLRQAKSETLSEVKHVENSIRDSELRRDQIQQSLSKSEHQIHKKIREIEKKRDKLLARISRIQRDNGLDDPGFTAETINQVLSPTN